MIKQSHTTGGEVIHLLGHLMEDCKNTKIDLDIILIDLEKAYDRIPKDINWPY